MQGKHTPETGRAMIMKMLQELGGGYGRTQNRLSDIYAGDDEQRIMLMQLLKQLQIEDFQNKKRRDPKSPASNPNVVR